MNRIIGTIIILLLTIALVTTEFIINTNTASSVNEKIYSADEMASKNQISEAHKKMDEAMQEWDHHVQSMLLFYSHQKPDEIEESLHTAKSYLDQGEISFFHAECKLIIIRLKQFNDLEYPTIRNIL